MQIAVVLGLMAATLSAQAGRLPELMTAKQWAAWEVQHPAPAATVAQTPDEPTLFFTGKPYDAASGTYLFKYRAYSPTLARWTSADPSGFPDGANNILTCNNNPTSMFDPLGLRPRYVQSGDITASWNLEVSSITAAAAEMVTAPNLKRWFVDPKGAAAQEFASKVIQAVNTYVSPHLPGWDLTYHYAANATYDSGTWSNPNFVFANPLTLGGGGSLGIKVVQVDVSGSVSINWTGSSPLITAQDAHSATLVTLATPVVSLTYSGSGQVFIGGSATMTISRTATGKEVSATLRE